MRNLQARSLLSPSALRGACTHTRTHACVRLHQGKVHPMDSLGDGNELYHLNVICKGLLNRKPPGDCFEVHTHVHAQPSVRPIRVLFCAVSSPLCRVSSCPSGCPLRLLHLVRSVPRPPVFCLSRPSNPLCPVHHDHHVRRVRPSGLSDRPLHPSVRPSVWYVWSVRLCMSCSVPFQSARPPTRSPIYSPVVPTCLFPLRPALPRPVSRQRLQR